MSQVFVTEDLVLKILDFVGTDEHNCLLRRVNSSFNRVISSYRKVSSPSDIRWYCSSAGLFSWAITDGGCPLEVCREIAVGYAALEGCVEVMQWCRSQDPPFDWGTRCCSAAAFGGHVDALTWLRSQTPPCPWNTEEMLNSAVDGKSIAVIEWLMNEGVCSQDEFSEMMVFIMMQYAGDWRESGVSLSPIIEEMVKRLTRGTYPSEDGVRVDPVLLGGFQALMGCLFDTEGRLSKSDMAKILSLLQKTAHSEVCNDELLDLVVETLRYAITSRSMLVQKMNLVQRMLQDSVNTLGRCDRKLWLSEEDEEEEAVDYPTRLAYVLLEMLGNRIPVTTLMGHVKTVLTRCFQSSDPHDRRGACCVISAMAEPCMDGFIMELPFIIPQLTKCAEDRECTFVRCMAFFALDHLCEHCQPIILHYHDVILNSVLDRIRSKDNADVVNAACNVLYRMCDALDSPALAPFLDDLVTLLSTASKTYDSTLTTKKCIMALGQVATGAGNLFWPYAENLLEDMQPLFKTSNELRCSALCLLGNIAIGGGRERFSPYASLGLSSALDIVSCKDSSPGDKEEAFVFICNLLKAIKSDFADHLSTWVPILISELKARDNTSPEAQTLKASVLMAMSALAKHVGVAFEPHFLSVYQSIRGIELVSDLTVRHAIFSTYAELIPFLHTHELVLLTSGQVDDITRSVASSCLTTIAGEAEESVAAEATDALVMLVERIGLKFLKMAQSTRANTQTFRMAILEKVMLVLEGKSACQQLMNATENLGSDNEESSEDDSDEDGSQSDDGADLDRGNGSNKGGADNNDAEGERECRAVLSSVFALINEMAKVIGSQFIGHFEDLRPLIFSYTEPKRGHILRAMAIGCLADTSHYIGPIMFQNAVFVESFLEVMEWGINDTSEMVRRNSAFGLSVVIQYLSHSSLSFYAPKVFMWISPLCHHRIQAGSANKGGADVDNILTALARLVEGCDSEEVPRLTSLSMLLEALPLREDFEEAKNIYTIIVNLVKSGDVAALTLMPKVLLSFAQALESSSRYSEETKALVTSSLSYLVSAGGNQQRAAQEALNQLRAEFGDDVEQQSAVKILECALTGL